MKSKIVLIDGGVIANFICSCGHTFRVSIWGMRYIYDKKGMIIKPKKYFRNLKKCRCGKRYIFVALPGLAYKELSEKEYKRETP